MQPIVDEAVYSTADVVEAFWEKLHNMETFGKPYVVRLGRG